MINHGYDQFHNANAKLILGKGRIKERLLDAIKELRFVESAQMKDENLRGRFDAIMSKMQPGLRSDRIDELSEDEAVELADEISDIFIRLSPR